MKVVVRRPSLIKGLGLLALMAAVLLVAPRDTAKLSEAPMAEGGHGGIGGRVYDLATGDPVSGARVTSGGTVSETSPDGTFTVTGQDSAGTDESGGARLRRSLRVEADGYDGATVALEYLDGDLQPPGVTLRIGLPPLAASDEAARAAAERLTSTGVFEPRPAGAAEAGDGPTGGGEERLAALAVSEVPPEIRVLMEDGSIVAMPTEEYLRGVVPAEMGYVFSRAMEALKAQAIASRTYAAGGCLAGSAGDPNVCEPGLDANVDTTTRTQVWRPVYYDTTDAAVQATAGLAVVQAGELVRTLYFARAVDRTLSSEDSRCCGGRTWSYLRSVSSPDPFHQPWGHGAGMSQEGAATLGAWGATAEEIVEHYYSDSQVVPAAAPTPGPTPGRAAGSALSGAITLTSIELLRGAALENDVVGREAIASEVIVESPPRRSGFPFMAAAVEWHTGAPTVDAAAPDRASTEPDVTAQLRVGDDAGAWSQWIDLPSADDEAPFEPGSGEHWSGLAIARGTRVQARLVRRGADDQAEPADLRVDGLTIHYFDTDPGPGAPVGASQLGGAVVPRSGWGADESLRYKDGAEIWPPEYTSPRALIVHHTVTENDSADPAAVVRAIYHYHAVTREWGDIGYNFLIDHRGNIYEGRFGGEREGRIVQGGHALQYNTNTVGIALLGTFTEPGAIPRPAAEDSLVDLLAVRATRYGIAPLQPVQLAGERFQHSVLGHRDVLPGHTVCPGDGLASRLPTLRQRVNERMSAPPTSLPASATPTPTRAPPTPAGCSSLILGGDFEADSPRWVRDRAYYTSWDAYTGARSLFVGLTSQEPDEAPVTARAYQEFAVPGGVGSAMLTYAVKTAGGAEDLRTIRILDSSGREVALGGASTPGQPWTESGHDVTAQLRDMAGETARLEIVVENDGDGDRSYMRVDDVSLTVCGGGGAPPTATPLPTATRTPSPTPEPFEPEVVCEDMAPSLLDADGWRATGDHAAQRGVFGPGSEAAVRLGGGGGFGYGALALDVPTPKDVVSARLALELRAEVGAGGGATVLEFRQRERGVRHVLVGPDPAEVGPTWRPHVFELESDWLNDGPQIYLAALGRATSPTYLYASGISLEVCRLQVERVYVPAAHARGTYSGRDSR